MNPVITRPSPAPVRSVRAIAFGAVAVVVALVMVAALTVWTRSPDVVDGLTIENPTPLPVHVSVSGGPGESTLGLGVVSPEGTATFDEVLDPGGEWMFHFASGRAPGGELTVSREQLAADDWSVTVPGDVVVRLAEEITPPPET